MSGNRHVNTMSTVYSFEEYSVIVYIHINYRFQ